MIEPASLYAYAALTDGASGFASEGVEGDIQVSSKGAGNSVVRGYKSVSQRSKISFSGNGSTVFLGPNSRVMNADIRVTGDNCLFYFGAFSTVESMIVMLTGPDGRIEIGDYCMLSARIIIDRSDHHSIYDLSTGERINKDKDVTVDDHVWIGRDTRIGKGVQIGRDSVIAQGSVVSGTVHKNSIYGGTPAKCIRQGVTWSRMKVESLSEMESSKRHAEFLARVAALEARIAQGK